MTTKEKINIDILNTSEIGDKQLNLLRDLTSFAIRIPLESAFGGRGSKKVIAMQAGLKTLLAKATFVKENHGKDNELVLENIKNKYSDLKEAEKNWKQGRVRGFEVKNVRDEANAAMDNLFETVKTKKNS
jgi:hypothetical protein